MPSWKKVIISGSSAELSSLFAPSITGSLQGTASIASTASFVTGSNVFGPFGANSVISASFSATSSLSLASTANQILVINKSGATIAKGVVVHLTGSNNSSDTPYITTASYESDSLSANSLGITAQSIAFNSTGYVTTEGVLTGLNVTGFIAGQVVYLGANGAIIGAAPQAPLHGVRLGQVVRDSPSNNGSIYVRIDNGYEIGELHDVIDSTTTSTLGDLLVKSGSVWRNSKQLTGPYGVTGSFSVQTPGANGIILDTDINNDTLSSRLFFKISGSGQDVSMRNSNGSLLFGYDATAGNSSGPYMMTLSSSAISIGNNYAISATRGAILQLSGSVNIEDGFAYKQDGENVIYIQRNTPLTSGAFNNTIAGQGAAEGTAYFDQMTVVGYNALYQSSGSDQTAVGYVAGYQNTGSSQTLIGWGAGYQGDASNQTAVGEQAGWQNTGSNQTAIGIRAGYRNSGSNQTAIGADAGVRNTATQQVAVGLQAGIDNIGVAQTAVGQQAGQENIGSTQTAVGYAAGFQNTGSLQVAIGSQAGRDNKGDLQTVTGYEAGRLNIEDNQSAYGYRAGYGNSGSNQTAIGTLAGRFNSGSNQTAVGVSAGEQNIGNTQTAIGAYAGYANTGSAQTVTGYEAGRLNTADFQTAVGYSAGYANTGSAQTAYGYQAGAYNSGSNQTATGYQAGVRNLGTNQTAVGWQAGYENTGSNQTAYGYQAGYQNSGSNQVAMGNSAGERNSGNNQTAIGSQAGYLNTGSSQTAVGSAAGYQNSGSDQVVSGYRSGYQNKGDDQTATGYEAGFQNTGIEQSAFGWRSGYQNSGANMTAVGSAAGYQNSGSGLVAVGVDAGRTNKGTQNTFIGFQAGYFTTGATVNTASTQSVFLGGSTTAGGASRTNQIVIGYNAEGIGSNSVVLGNSNILITALRGFVGIGTTTPTASLHVNNTTNSASFLVEDSTNPDITPFIIDATGNVGIGTTTPTAKLVVSGSTIISGSLTTTSSVAFTSYTSPASFPGTASGYLAFDSSGNIITTGGVAAGAAGSNTQLQYNSGSVLAGTSAITFDGTTLRATGSFTGSLVGALTGTASFATSASRSVTASFAITSSYITASGVFGPYGANSVLSASYALTASFLTPNTNAFIQGGNSFGTTALLGTNDNQNLNIETSGSVRMSISSSGDVGIGTTTPTAKLDIVYASSAGTGVLIRGGGGALDSTPLKLWDLGTAINNRNIIEFGHNSTYVTASRIYSINPSPNATTGGKLVLETTSDNIGTLNTSQLVLSNNGNVGIGTDTPTYTLQIQSGATASIRLQETGSGGNKRLDLTIDGSGTARISANQSAQSIAFDTVGSERIRITKDGDVGIGTTSPLGKLTVSGSGGYLSYNDTNSAGNLLVLSGSSDELVRIDVSALSASVNTVLSYGIRGVNDTTFATYGKVTDGFMYASNFVNGLNIINYGEGTKEDYIRLYAGKNADGTTPDLHIQGSGSNKGFIGINKIDPNAQLDVNGSTIITGSLTVGNGTNTNLDPYGFVFGSGSYLKGSTANSAILGGTFNKIDTAVNGANNVILGGTRNIITGSNLLGSGHTDSAIIGGSLNTIHSSTPGAGEMIAASYSSSISDANSTAIIATRNSNIIGTFQVPESAAIIASEASEINSSNNVAIISGYENKIEQYADNSLILGGVFNLITDSVDNSAVIGGFGITGSQNNTVYMPNAQITGSVTAEGGGYITGSLNIVGVSGSGDAMFVKNAFGDGLDFANYDDLTLTDYPVDYSYVARYDGVDPLRAVKTYDILHIRRMFGYNGTTYVPAAEEIVSVAPDPAGGTRSWNNQSTPGAYSLRIMPSGSVSNPELAYSVVAETTPLWENLNTGIANTASGSSGIKTYWAAPVQIGTDATINGDLQVQGNFVDSGATNSITSTALIQAGLLYLSNNF